MRACEACGGTGHSGPGTGAAQRDYGRACAGCGGTGEVKEAGLDEPWTAEDEAALSRPFEVRLERRWAVERLRWLAKGLGEALERGMTDVVVVTAAMALDEVADEVERVEAGLVASAGWTPAQAAELLEFYRRKK